MAHLMFGCKRNGSCHVLLYSMPHLTVKRKMVTRSRPTAEKRRTETFYMELQMHNSEKFTIYCNYYFVTMYSLLYTGSTVKGD